MSRTSTLRRKSAENLGLQGLQRYDYFGDSELVFYEPNDTKALETLANHFRIPRITLESFRSIGGKRFVCTERSTERRVFPPLANA